MLTLKLFFYFLFFSRMFIMSFLRLLIIIFISYLKYKIETFYFNFSISISIVYIPFSSPFKKTLSIYLQIDFIGLLKYSYTSFDISKRAFIYLFI